MKTKMTADEYRWPNHPDLALLIRAEKDYQRWCKRMGRNPAQVVAACESIQWVTNKKGESFAIISLGNHQDGEVANLP